MPALQAVPLGSSVQHTRSVYKPHHSPLRPIFTHGIPSATRHNSTLLLPCNASGTLLFPDSRLISFSTAADALNDDTTTALALSPTGIHAVHGRRSGRVSLYHIPTRRTRALAAPTDNVVVSLAAFDASGSYVALATADGKVRVVGVENGAVTHLYSNATENTMLSAIAFHPVPGEAALLLAAENGVVRKCDLLKPKLPPKVICKKHVATVSSFAFADNGDVVVTASADTLLCFAKWRDMENAKLVSTDERLVSVVRPGDEECRFVLSIGEKGVIRRWDARTARENVEGAFALPFVSVDEEADTAKEDESDEEREDRKIRVQPVSMTMCGSQELVVSMSDHTLLFVPVSEDGVLSGVRKVISGNLEEIYDIRTLRTRETVETSSSQERRDIAVASNSSVLWIMRMSGHAKTDITDSDEVENSDATNGEQEIRTWSCHAGLSGHTGILMCLDAFTYSKGIGKDSLADSFLATSSRDKTARVWRRSKATGTWSCMAVAEGHTDTVGAVAISSATAAGKFYIVTGAADKTIKRWSLDQAHKVAERLERAELDESSTLGGKNKIDQLDNDESDQITALSATWTTLAHTKDVNTVAISPEGSMIATGSQDRTVKLWNATKGSLLHTCSGHRRGVWNVTFSNVDRIVASGSADSTIRVWNVSSGACLRSFEGHLSGVLRCIFMSAGTQIASAGADGLVKVWATRSGECATTIDAHENRAWALDKIDDGDILLSAGADGLARIWRDATQEQKLAEVEKKEEEALMAQEVQNAARAGRWTHAARGALQLGMTQKLRSIVISLISTADVPEVVLRQMITGLKGKAKEGDDGKESWALVTKLFLCCRDWNASGGAKNAAIAAHVLQALFSTWTPDILCDSLNVDKRALVEALNAHCSRHLERVSQFSSKLAVLEHTLQQMRALGDISDAANKETKTSQKRSVELAPEVKEDTTSKKPKWKRKRREDFPSNY